MRIALGLACTLIGGTLLGCPGDASSCLGGGEATPARYQDCETRCHAGESAACDMRGEVEGQLSVRCHTKGDVPACRALCEGRRHDQQACARLREGH
jgi:hypothetical protein